MPGDQEVARFQILAMADAEAAMARVNHPSPIVFILWNALKAALSKPNRAAESHQSANLFAYSDDAARVFQP